VSHQTLVSSANPARRTIRLCAWRFSSVTLCAYTLMVTENASPLGTFSGEDLYKLLDPSKYLGSSLEFIARVASFEDETNVKG
jgi:hypothetical protein